jgi:hypothetical protein
MADSPVTEFQRQLDNVADLLELLVHVSDEKVPQLKNDISNIVDKIEGGFDKEELASQVRAVINKVISESRYVKLERDIDINTKKMIDAITSSSRHIEQWRDNYHNRSKWHIGLISGAIFFCIGFGACYWWNKPTVSQQEQTRNDLYTIAKYVKDNATPQSKPAPTAKKKAKVVKDDSDEQSDN